MSIQPDAVYTIKEVSEFLKVSESTLRRWCQVGELEFVKFGNNVRIKGEAILSKINPAKGKETNDRAETTD